MNKLDKVEKVRDKTGVSYEEAKDALEQCDYDMLDAIVLLERQGKARTQTASYATATDEIPNMSQAMVQAQQDYEQSSKKSKFNEVFDRLMEGVKRLCKRGLEVSFVVERKGARVLSMPVLILAILVLFLFPATIPLLVVGLFFGFRYHFEGMGTLTVDINEAMDRAANGAESLKRDVMENE